MIEGENDETWLDPVKTLEALQRGEIETANILSMFNNAELTDWFNRE